MVVETSNRLRKAHRALFMHRKISDFNCLLALAAIVVMMIEVQLIDNYGNTGNPVTMALKYVPVTG